MPTDRTSHNIYKTVDVNGIDIFYREAGPAEAPVLLLLHGYPSSSRMFEPLFARLRQRYRLVAPDYPGFGLSGAPDRSKFAYTFEHMAQTIDDFAEVLGLTRYSLYLQDYGGPIGSRARTLSLANNPTRNCIFSTQGTSRSTMNPTRSPGTSTAS